MPQSLRRRVSTLTLFLAVASASIANAQPALQRAAEDDAAEHTTEQYIRVLSEGKSSISLQVALVRFVPRGATDLSRYVDLVGAVHIADQSYFQDLNQRFEDYDVVLYEMVLEEPEIEDDLLEMAESTVWIDSIEADDEPKMSMVSRAQIFMKDSLGLSFQLDEVDYSVSNMVHADMTQAEFEASMSDRGESMFTMMASIMMAGMASPPKTSNMDMLLAFLSSDRELAFKRIAARELAGSEATFDRIEGEEGSVLITERNRKAMSVLREQLDAGQQRLAIFYGAGHMKDMAERLENEFAMVPHSVSWLDAWDLTSSEPEGGLSEPAVQASSTTQ